MMKQLYLKNNQGWILNLYTKMNYKFIRDLNIQEKTVEYLEIVVIVGTSSQQERIFFNIILFIYCQLHWVFIAARAFLQLWRVETTLQLQCTGFSLLWLRLSVEHGLQSTQASVVVRYGLNSCSSEALEHRLGSCGTQVLFPHAMWDLPGLGIKPVSPALAGGFFTTKLPGKPRKGFLKNDTWHA